MEGEVVYETGRVNWLRRLKGAPLSVLMAVAKGYSRVDELQVVTGYSRPAVKSAVDRLKEWGLIADDFGWAVVEGVAEEVSG